MFWQKMKSVDQWALYIGAFCDLDTLRANGEYRRFLHIWSVGDDTNSRADKKLIVASLSKVSVELILLPITLRISLWLKRIENVDYFDKATNLIH